MFTDSYSHKTRLGFNEYAIIALCLIVSTVLSLYYQSNQIIAGDQLQMLQKGFKGAIEGVYLPYGNEASTVGNVPGSLSSLLIGIPLSFSLNPYSIIVVLTVLRIVGALLFINALTLLFSPRTVVFGAAIYLLSPWFLYESLVYNPTYLSFGAALCLNMLVRLRASDINNKKPSIARFSYSLLLMLSIGWCLQLHFSWPVLVALIGLLWLKKSIKVSYIGIIVGIVLVLITLYPYFKELLVNEAIRHNPDQSVIEERYFGYGLVHVYPLFKALLYWIRFGSLLITNKAIVPDSFGSGIMLESIRYAYIALTQVVGVITVIMSAYASYYVLFKVRITTSKNITFVKDLVLCSVFALLIAAAAATLVLNYWQIIILYAFAILPILVMIEKKKKLNKKYIVFFIIYVIAINLVAASNSKKFNYHYSYYDQVMAFYEQNYANQSINPTFINSDNEKNIDEDKIVEDTKKIDDINENTSIKDSQELNNANEQKVINQEEQTTQTEAKVVNNDTQKPNFTQENLATDVALDKADASLEFKDDKKFNNVNIDKSNGQSGVIVLDNK